MVLWCRIAIRSLDYIVMLTKPFLKLVCMLMLAMGSSTIQSQPPATSGGVQAQKQQTAKPTQDTVYKQQGAESMPLVVKGIPAVESEDDRKHKAYEQHEKPTLDRVLTWSTVALAVFTFLLFFFTAALWLVTYRLSSVARKEFNSTHRPMIRVRHVWPSGDLWEGGTFAINTQIVNVGLTKAKITEYSATTLILPNGKQLPAVPLYGYCMIVKKDLFLESGQSTDLPPMTEQIRSITQEDNGAIRGNRKLLYCFGYIRYEDTESRVRTTAFCRRLEIPTGVGSFSELGRFVRLEPENEDYEYQD